MLRCFFHIKYVWITVVSTFRFQRVRRKKLGVAPRKPIPEKRSGSQQVARPALRHLHGFTPNARSSGCARDEDFGPTSGGRPFQHEWETTPIFHRYSEGTAGSQSSDSQKGGVRANADYQKA